MSFEVPQRYSYTSRELNPASGSMYYRFRQYHPRLGRFLRRDPILYRDGPNTYGFVAARPTYYYDPYGLAVRDLARVPIHDAAGRYCGTVLVAREDTGVDAGMMYFLFEDMGRDAKCGCCAGSKFGWIQHVCEHVTATGRLVGCRYDNAAFIPPGGVHLIGRGAESDPTRNPQPRSENDRPPAGAWRENPWFGGEGTVMHDLQEKVARGTATPDERLMLDNWVRNPSPQEAISDKPGGGNEYVAQLVCEKGGKVFFQWQYSRTAPGHRRR